MKHKPQLLFRTNIVIDHRMSNIIYILWMIAFRFALRLVLLVESIIKKKRKARANGFFFADLFQTKLIQKISPDVVAVLKRAEGGDTSEDPKNE